MDDNQKDQATPESNSIIHKFMGREYDLATPEGRAGFEAASSTMESLVGKQANELGETRKKLRKLEEVKDVDKVSLMAEVARLREEGEHQAADQMMLDYADATRLSLEAKASEEAWYEEYYQSRKDDFNGLPKEMVKTFLRANKQVLKSAEDSAAAADNLIKPLVPAKATVSEQDEVFSSPSAASKPTGSSKEVKSQEKEAEEAPKAWDDMLSRMGFE